MILFPNEIVAGVHTIRLNKVEDQYDDLTFYSSKGDFIKRFKQKNIRSPITDINLDLYGIKLRKLQEIPSKHDEYGWMQIEFNDWDNVCKFEYTWEDRGEKVSGVSISCYKGKQNWNWGAKPR